MLFKSKESRTIFIGDVHGCLEELQEMIRILKPGPQDRVILLGDLINRGPNSVGVVRYVHESGFECLMGNHEAEYLKTSESVQKYQKFRAKLGENLHDWIKTRPLFIESDEFMAVHAGLEPGVHPSRSQPHIVLNIRTWGGDPHRLKDPDQPPWFFYYRGLKPVFYGHWARLGLNLRQNTLGLDSGVVYGRYLSSYILETKQLVQVKAFKRHYIPPALRKNPDADDELPPGSFRMVVPNDQVE